MSKLKLSFSFLLTLLLVGMFSVVAFAATPDVPTGVKWSDDGTSITVRWQAVSGATSYKIYVDGTAQGSVLTNTGTVTGLSEKTTYSIEVTAINTDGESAKSTPVSALTGTGAPTHNSTLVNGLAYNDSDLDNGIINNNQTGVGAGTQNANFNQVIKSDDMVKNADGSHGTQRTHGEYMNNTNSCASCHQTHTGASESLLFKDGRYQTCTACHDGTLGFYNVFTGSNSAGTFGGTHDGNMSVHLANGTVELKAAPGGNKDATSGSWTEEFSCASCHAPHGSYSSRLLNENPNEMGNTLVQNGGKRLQNIPVVTDISVKVSTADVNYTDAAGNPKYYNYVVYKFNIGDIGAPTNADYTTKGLTTTGDTVLQLMKWDSTAGPKDAQNNPVGAYVIDTDPWLHGYEFDPTHSYKIYWTAFRNAAGKEYFTTDLLKEGVVYGKGFAGVKAANLNNDVIIVPAKGATPKTTAKLSTIISDLTYGNIARGYVVKLDVSAPDANNVTTTNAASLWASKTKEGDVNGNYVSGRGVAMSGFCAACHTDYLASSGKESGTFDHAYRHTTTSDSYTCVRCHYAHGTDVTIMRDARGKTYTDILGDTTNYFPTVTDPTAREATVKDYLMDKNPSSSLKRYTNMAVCWACHTSSHSEGTRNTDSYQYNPNAGIDTDRNGIEFDY